MVRGKDRQRVDLLWTILACRSKCQAGPGLGSPSTAVLPSQPHQLPPSPTHQVGQR